VTKPYICISNQVTMITFALIKQQPLLLLLGVNEVKRGSVWVSRCPVVVAAGEKAPNLRQQFINR
jgi:hypothetical protein